MTKIHDRDQIVDAAARLFSRNGYEATSLDDIAAELGTARSALYYHVSGKAELRALVQIERVRMLVDQGEAIVRSDAAADEKLAALVTAHVRHFARFYPESKMWSSITTADLVSDVSSDELHRRQEEVEGHLRQVIAEGIGTGTFQAADVPVAALSIIGMCNYLATWYRPGGRLSIEEIAGMLAEMAVRSLR